MENKINQNEIYTVKIIDMSHEGMGIGKINGFTVFVKDAIVEEEVEIKIVKVKKKFAYAKILKIIKTSENRVNPVCTEARRCGGCNLQHMSYEAQLNFKTQKVVNSIKKIGKIKNANIYNTIGMDDPTEYRNNIQYHVDKMEDKAVVGFYEPQSRKVIEPFGCVIKDNQTEKISNFIRDFINKHELSVYNETTGEGLIRHIVIKTGFKTHQKMLIIVTSKKHLPKKDVLIKEIISNFPNIKSIVQSINTAKTNVVLGKEYITLYGSDIITDYIGELKFNISPLSFYQVNPIQTEVLYNKVLEYADLTGEETVFDAYCGIGTISLFLAKHSKNVYGIEINKQAIADAKVNAQTNNIDNVEFITGKSETKIPQLYKKGIKPDVIVVDPPRKGCDKELIDTIIEIQPKRLIYVSCDVGTLARDLNYLQNGGYNVEKVQPVDMFPYTHHVECVVLIDI